MNTTAQRESGSKAQIANITAAKVRNPPLAIGVFTDPMFERESEFCI